MTHDTHNPQDDFDGLIGDLLDAKLSADQHAQLSEQLRSDPAACKALAQQMALQAMLEVELNDLLPPLQVERLVGHALRDNEPLAISRKPLAKQEEQTANSQQRTANSGRGASPTRKSWLNRASRRPLRPSLGVAAMIMIGLLLGLGAIPVSSWFASSNTQEAKTTAKKPVDMERDHVARLVDWHKPVWVDGTKPPPKDPRLLLGKRLAIKSGLIELKYKTGARVVIEGPAEFVVGSQQSAVSDQQSAKKETARSSAPSPQSQDPESLANTGYLALGKLVARVEGKDAKGFTIDTPSARVEDLGTEFGVEVLGSGAADVVVLTGEVDVVQEGAEGRPSERIRLTQHQGAFVAANGGAIARRMKVDAHIISSMQRRLKRVQQTPVFATLDFESLTAGPFESGATLDQQDNWRHHSGTPGAAKVRNDDVNLDGNSLNCNTSDVSEALTRQSDGRFSFSLSATETSVIQFDLRVGNWSGGRCALVGLVDASNNVLFSIGAPENSTHWVFNPNSGESVTSTDQYPISVSSYHTMRATINPNAFDGNGALSLSVGTIGGRVRRIAGMQNMNMRLGDVTPAEMTGVFIQVGSVGGLDNIRITSTADGVDDSVPEIRGK